MVYMEYIEYMEYMEHKEYKEYKEYEYQEHRGNQYFQRLQLPENSSYHWCRFTSDCYFCFAADCNF